MNTFNKVLSVSLSLSLLTGVSSYATKASAATQTRKSQWKSSAVTKQAKGTNKINVDHFTLEQKRAFILENLSKAKPLPDLPKSVVFTQNTKQAFVKKLKTSKTPYYKPNHIILKLKNGATPSSLSKLGLFENGKKERKIAQNTYSIALNGKQSFIQSIKTLHTSGLVEYAEPDYVRFPTSDDPLFNELWGLKNIGQAIQGSVGIQGMDINIESAWTKTKGNESVLVGVVDTGLDVTQKDVSPNVWTNSAESGSYATDGIDNDNNGYIDDQYGWDFFKKDNTVYDGYKLDDAHATHVAGTIAAKGDNKEGIIGVAPNVKVMALKFIDPMVGGFDSDAVSAFEYARKKGVKIYNNSWCGYGFSQSLYDAMKANPGLFVVAAGNEGMDIDMILSEIPQMAPVPASFDLPNVLTVSSINNKGKLSEFSNYGKKSADIAAPGENILSAIPTDYAGLEIEKGWFLKPYEYLSGTSMATPHVSGVAALLASMYPKASTSELKGRILSNAKRIDDLSTTSVTGGILNATAAITGDLDNNIPGTTMRKTNLGTLNAKTDKDDVYAMNLKKGEKVVLNLIGAPDTDYDLYVYGPEGYTTESIDGLLSYSEKENTSTESITFVAPENGPYYVDVSAFKGSDYYVLTSKQGVGAGTYEENNGNVNYFGEWEATINKKASSGKYNQTNTKKSSASLIFNGTSIKWIATKDATQGMAKVIIDGGKPIDVNLYAKTAAYKSTIFSRSNLKPGRHVIDIQYTGKAAPGAKKTATKINIDSLIVK